jgi:S-methylmethionine-dependent homocysteine/selenocysteine methylase
MPRPIRLLDGPLGTELAVRGVATPLPAWSAHALDHAPEVVSAIHRDYAAAGATIHTAATFRTRENAVGERWEALARRAVALARDAVPRTHRVAGSLAPLNDCYRPELAPRPKAAREAHAALAGVLADAGADLLLCETFPDVREGLIAVDCAVATGCETWAAFTPGPDGRLLSPEALADAGRAAARRGARAVLLNCVAASGALPYLSALVEAVDDPAVGIGVYANAGEASEGIGWGAGPQGAFVYAELAARWAEAGATIIGGCCGTGPGHIAEVRRRLARERPLAEPAQAPPG